MLVTSETLFGSVPKRTSVNAEQFWNVLYKLLMLVKVDHFPMLVNAVPPENALRNERLLFFVVGEKLTRSHAEQLSNAFYKSLMLLKVDKFSMLVNFEQSENA